MHTAASNIALRMCSTPSRRPQLANPVAISALSCGQIDPLWYDMGLYRASPSATVLMPQPEKNEEPRIRSETAVARSFDAIPERSTCPALLARTLHLRFLPSSAKP